MIVLLIKFQIGKLFCLKLVNFTFLKHTEVIFFYAIPWTVCHGECNPKKDCCQQCSLIFCHYLQLFLSLSYPYVIKCYPQLFKTFTVPIPSIITFIFFSLKICSSQKFKQLSFVAPQRTGHNCSGLTFYYKEMEQEKEPELLFSFLKLY